MDIGHRNMEDSYQESADPSFEWDSAESDTESLAQERAYQQELQWNINQISPGERAGFNNNVNASLKTTDSAVDDEDMWVLDSLEMSNSKFMSKNSILGRGKGLVHQIHGNTNR
uniref:Uncharacterized protein n=1 Tax=Knipowitschia caucasica TaxID=637954 RepID=A0AAV2JCA3_KNICA